MATPIIGLATGYIQSLLSSSSNTKTSPDTASISASSPQSDTSQLSPFAQLMNTLQQLQETDPAKYSQVTAQIGSKLESAAQTAQSQGNTAAANELSQLSTDFTNASKSGQMPNVQDLAQAVGHMHGHHHHAHAASSDSDSNPLLAAFQTSSSPSEALNPMSIMTDTLSSAGAGAD